MRNDETRQLAFQCLMRFTDCAASESEGLDEWPPRPVPHKLGRLYTHSFLFRFQCKSPFYTSNGNKCIDGVTVWTTTRSSGGRGFNPSTVHILFRITYRFRVEDGHH